MPVTYNNNISGKEVSIAIEQVLLAPSNTTSWSATPVRVNAGSPPAGYVNLGAVVEDSPQLQVTRERFQLRTGIPQVLQFQAVRGMGGTFAVSFHSNSNKIVSKALGNVDQQKTIIGTYGSAVGIASVGAGVLGFTEIYATTTANVASFSVGDFITAGTSATQLAVGDIEGFVDATSSNGLIRISSPGFLTLIDNTFKVAEVKYSQVAAGTSKIKEFTVLGVADFLDGSQVVHHMPRAQPTGEWTETIRPDNNVMVAASFDLVAYNSTTYDGGNSHLVIAERFYIPPTQ